MSYCQHSTVFESFSNYWLNEGIILYVYVGSRFINQHNWTLFYKNSTDWKQLLFSNWKTLTSNKCIQTSFLVDYFKQLVLFQQAYDFFVFVNVHRIKILSECTTDYNWILLNHGDASSEIFYWIFTYLDSINLNSTFWRI